VRAFVIRGPGEAGVEEVDDPVAGPGEVVVAIARVGVCGTDVECFTGEMAYLRQGISRYPLRIGHEWCGTVVEVGPGVDPSLVGRWTTGDTMIGCGRCRRCLTGRGHLCAERSELGLRGAWDGAAAERLRVPASSLHPLPDSIDDVAGALVEPGANALRAMWGADPRPGDRILVIGAGSIGILAAWFLLDRGADVHVAGRSRRSIAFARGLGLPSVSSTEAIPGSPWDAVIDASNDANVPARALEFVEPGGRVVCIGLAGVPSLIDTRDLALAEVTAVGVLGGSAGLDDAIAAYAAGRIDPRPLVGPFVGLDGLAAALAGERPAGTGPGPKIHVDPGR